MIEFGKTTWSIANLKRKNLEEYGGGMLRIKKTNKQTNKQTNKNKQKKKQTLEINGFSRIDTNEKEEFAFWRTKITSVGSIHFCDHFSRVSAKSASCSHK